MGKNWRCTRRGCLKMSGNVTELRPKQQEAILALLTTTNVEQAARAVKITPRTLYRWQQDPEFDKVFRKARRDAFGQGTARLQQSASAAGSTVLKVMVDQHTDRKSTRLNSSHLGISYAVFCLK